MKFDIDDIDETDAPDRGLAWNCTNCDDWWTEDSVYNHETSDLMWVKNSPVRFDICPNGCTDHEGKPLEVLKVSGNKITPYEHWLKDELIKEACKALAYFKDINSYLEHDFLDDYSLTPR